MMEKSFVIWTLDYLLNSAWQVPLVLLVALLAAKLVARLHSATANHRIVFRNVRRVTSCVKI